MNRKAETIAILALTAALIAGAGAPAEAEGPWQLKLSGISAQSTAGGGPNSSLGGGLGLEYRATPRLGVELGGLTTEFEDDASFDFFGTVFIAEQEFRITPVLARLNVHLTPGRRFDLYLGPVAGHVSVGDVVSRLRIREPGMPEQVAPEIRFETHDQFTWGAHLGVDLRLGTGGSYLTAGATYLDLPLELDVPIEITEEGDDNEIDPLRSDLDPLVFHFGYSHRF